jgi:hypothetical protein
MEDILNNKSLSKIAEEIYQKNKKATLWDVLVIVLSKHGNVEPFIIWILSDLPVMELTAKGHSVNYIASFLEMPSREVVSTCKTWGMRCFKQTLDFDPTLVYNDGMTVEAFAAKLEPVISVMPSNEILEDAIINVEKYRSIIKLLKEWEE